MTLNQREKKAIKLLLKQWLIDEEKSYYCDSPNDKLPWRIPTDKLRPSAYWALRVLKDGTKTKTID
jgi:hypothetical protein